MITHQPKGGMCLACTKKFKDCSSLKFSEMPKLKAVSDNTVIVRCTNFARVN